MLNLLAAAYGGDWNTDVLGRLLSDAGYAGKSLEAWLRDGFFQQHCELFHQRPFIWHIWDGLRDGFSALVNYHKLDQKNLETLIYTYLGDWITRQSQAAASGVDGAQEKLAAAEQLKKRLELILAGEAPHDIFVRWKPLHQQPIGWDPDINDGVRLNIRPFMSVPDLKAKGAGILRVKPKIKWDKDRGKEPQRPRTTSPGSGAGTRKPPTSPADLYSKANASTTATTPSPASDRQGRFKNELHKHTIRPEFP
ncbi:MAG UNVERIFIED_CONTAM: BREX-1 system adenine-specific DNA-methyltransferase PglX [Planctomycetaceae bacterium]